MKPKQGSCGVMMPIALAAVAIVLLGPSGVQSQNRIINGEEAGEGEFPFVVALYVRDATGPKFNCGGSIIDERHILTAAHCMGLGAQFVVKLGCHSRSECSGPELTIEDFITHPNFDESDNDLAIIRTKEVIEFAEFRGLGSVRKIDFPDSTLGDYFELESLTVAGWGKAASNEPESQDVLRKVSLQAIPEAQCNRAKGHHICTRTPGVNACRGDSGGPLIRYLPNGTVSLVGVVQGPGDFPEHDDSCNPELGTLFMRVAVYAKWIRDCMASTNFSSPSCSSPDD